MAKYELLIGHGNVVVVDLTKPVSEIRRLNQKEVQGHLSGITVTGYSSSGGSKYPLSERAIIHHWGHETQNNKYSVVNVPLKNTGNPELDALEYERQGHILNNVQEIIKAWFQAKQST